MPVVTANGIEIYYERLGSGPPLLWFNGSGGTIARTRALLDPYAEHFDVVAHDQRGLGQTSIPRGPYEMADYAADAAALLDAIGWERCRVVGTSFGGMVAQQFAVTWPERVERLALLCTSPGGAYASAPLQELARMPADDAAASRTTMLDTRFTPEWLATHDDDRVLMELMARHYANRATGDARRGELAQLDARSRHDCVDQLGAIMCPTFVASGRYDGIAPPENGAAIAERVPNAQLHLYEGGHLFFAQDTSAMPEILTFLLGDKGV